MGTSERVRSPLSDGRGGEIYVVEADVVSVKPVTTRDGAERLILTCQGPESQAPVWVEDTPENRRFLNIPYGKTNTPKDYNHQRERQASAPVASERFEHDDNEDIPF